MQLFGYIGNELVAVFWVGGRRGQNEEGLHLSFLVNTFMFSPHLSVKAQMFREMFRLHFSHLDL